ncbi:MAG: PD40 domain-containing protein [Bacteroidales bacterium]|nr:PD40 domain-containing protein [Bacteroidales bacterium]
MKFFYSLLILLVTYSAIAQRSPKKAFGDGDYYFLNEQYDKAAEAYLETLIQDSTHYNCAFKLGVCYINQPYKIWKALPFLEFAVQGTSAKYKDNSYKTRVAPYEAFYYLAYAYQITLQSDKAIEYFEKYKGLGKDTSKIYDDVDVRIAACKNAKLFFENPKAVEIQNVGRNVNSAASEFNPCVSENDSVMYFTKENVTESDNSIQVSYRIMRSYKSLDPESGEYVWNISSDITEELMTEGKCMTVSTSHDGKTLILYRDNDYYGGPTSIDKGTLYISYLREGIWTPIQKLPGVINTSQWEMHASISKDGNTLYFTSNGFKPDVGMDIYYSEKNSSGGWSKAKSLSDVINTNFDEASPFIVDDTVLFFSSKGHNNMGGYDVFKSIKDTAGNWSTPENLSIPINSPLDDIFFSPVDHGHQAYYAVERPDGYLSFGKKDIFHIVIIDPKADSIALADSIAAAEALKLETAAAVGTSNGNAAGEIASTNATGKSNTNASSSNGVQTASGNTTASKATNNQTTQTSQTQINQEQYNTATSTRTSASQTMVSTFEIQIFASYVPMDIQKKFPNLSVVEHYGNESYYRYATGPYKTSQDAKADLQRIRSLGYPDAFIRKTQYYVDDAIKFDLSQKHTVQLFASMKRINAIRKFQPLKNILEKKTAEGMYVYYYGSFKTWKEAKEEADKIKASGIECFIQNLEAIK